MADDSSPTRVLRTLGGDARPPEDEAPSSGEPPLVGDDSSPTRVLRTSGGDARPPEQDEDPLPPLPVRPPRIPSLRPDPRLGPPPVVPSATSSAAELEPQLEPELEPPSAPPAPVEPPEPERPGEPGDADATTAEPDPARPERPAVSGPPAEATVALPHVGERPPTYDPEPTALPSADPDLLGTLVPDTVIDGARYGTMTLRAASVRGDSARYRGDNRGDRLLTARFGEGADALLAVVIATSSADEPSVADDACRQLAAAIGRSRAQLLGDLRTGAQENLRYGLQRLTARATVRLRGADSEAGNSGALHALIAPLDPTTRLRAGFGVGPGALLLLGDEAWYDAYAGRRLVQQQPSAEPESDPGRFRFRVVVPEPGDVLLLCSDGLAQPLCEEPAVSDFLADHWAHPHPPGMVDYLRHVQVRAKGYAADRTAVALWED
ncbi:protein phosphatase 2C domain-containing protein [Streptacidiphilus sp. P02-A3a]|uniref:protein phosphatase 2C domain-containing protein n=1 Tax=Streptacidiphilus sp. P02-A3a TaxID=2704468 RepID=UPI0015F8EB10|nr:protein phosphatase 2C domain-containing protein [Streptacidiphilus sp. P02-A3a]QMU68646.1 protein phosphatase 2C domain-containing protein [Streptacidiphilus sp. P02-A3a]